MTKVNLLIDKILKNWPAKVICLIVAIFLYIFHQASLFDKRSFVLPVTVIQEGGVMPVGDYAKNVTVVVRASTDKITSIHMGQITASVNLNNISKPGEYSVPVNINVSKEIMVFDPFEIKVKPETIKINVEKKAAKYIEVKPNIIGEPEYGYTYSVQSVEPAYIQIGGPETLLQDINSIETEKIDISGAKSNQNFEVLGMNLNKMVSIKDKGPFKVNIQVDPIIIKKTFENVVVQPVSVPDNVEIVSELPKVTITLQGTMNLLENFSLNSYSAQADFKSIQETGKYELPIKYVYPSYFKLVDSSLNSAKYEVIVIPDEPETNDELYNEENEAELKSEENKESEENKSE